MAEMKKGFLLTIGAMIIVIPVLLLSMLIYNMGSQTEDRISELMRLDRLNGLDYSIQQGFKKILTETSGVTARVNQTQLYLNFSEQLNGRNIGEISSSFTTSLLSFESFLESKYTEPDVEIKNYVRANIQSELPFFVEPYGAVYSHDPVLHKIIFAPEKHEHIRKCIKPCTAHGYEVHLVTGMEPHKDGWISAPTECADGQRCLNVLVKVTFVNGMTSESTLSLNPAKTSNIDINFKNALSAVVITLSDPGMLIIREQTLSSVINSVRLRVNLDSTDYPNELLSLRFPDNLISIDFKEMGVTSFSTLSFN